MAASAGLGSRKLKAQFDCDVWWCDADALNRPTPVTKAGSIPARCHTKQGEAMTQQQDDERRRAWAKEARCRAEEGCTGDVDILGDQVCNVSDLMLENWCSECLMARLSEMVDALLRERDEAQRAAAHVEKILAAEREMWLGVSKERDEAIARANAVVVEMECLLDDKPQENGEYVHHGICNFDRRRSVGERRCNCLISRRIHDGNTATTQLRADLASARAEIARLKEQQLTAEEWHVMADALEYFIDRTNAYRWSPGNDLVAKVYRIREGLE